MHSKRDAPHQWAVCVYCASGPTHPELLALAAELGEAIADRGWTLVWGGGNVSAMGALATAARARGAWTVGVIPKMLVRREVADHDADELIVTDTMRERKQIMEDRSDAFIALPGGIGTLEELFEAWTGGYLGYARQTRGAAGPRRTLRWAARMALRTPRQRVRVADGAGPAGGSR